MDEQLKTFSVRVRDAAVSLAERGPGVDLFFSYSWWEAIRRTANGPTVFGVGVNAEFDGVVGGGCFGWICGSQGF